MFKHWVAVAVLILVGGASILASIGILVKGEVDVKGGGRRSRRVIHVTGQDAALYALIPGLFGASLVGVAYLYWRENIDMSR